MVATTREAADAVLTAPVIAHVGELDALVDVLAVDVAVAFGAELFEGGRSRFGAGIAGQTPGLADGTAADGFQVVAVHVFGADAVAVVQEAGLLALVDAAGARFI